MRVCEQFHLLRACLADMREHELGVVFAVDLEPDVLSFFRVEHAHGMCVVGVEQPLVLKEIVLHPGVVAEVAFDFPAVFV